tara:strand:+ start:60 stop:596 length:537 start_codon:yes stop_codon:yes gene_type:complete
MSDKPILFYSPNCQYCKILWQNLSEKRLLDNIHKINVHENKLPANITSVPTLLIKGRPLLTGNAIELYFNSYNRSNVTKNNENVKQHVEETIKEFLPGEMGSAWSDNYSYLDADTPIDHSYSFLSNNNTGIPDVTSTNNNYSNDRNSKSGKNDDIARRMEALKSSREMDINKNARSFN